MAKPNRVVVGLGPLEQGKGKRVSDLGSGVTFDDIALAVQRINSRGGPLGSKKDGLVLARAATILRDVSWEKISKWLFDRKIRLMSVYEVYDDVLNGKIPAKDAGAKVRAAEKLHKLLVVTLSRMPVIAGELDSMYKERARVKEEAVAKGEVGNSGGIMFGEFAKEKHSKVG
jgi:hypothetical protein